MTSARARRLAAAAVLAALVATAGCGDGGSDEETSPEPVETTSAETTTPEESETTEDDGETNGEIFLGSDSEEPSASAIELPRTKVGEPAQGVVEIKAPDDGTPEPLRDEQGTIDGEDVEIVQSCAGEVPPCTVVFAFTPTVAGPYTGELTVTLADGTTVTAAIHGEAVEGDPTDTETPDTESPDTETPDTETPGPTTSEPVTPEPVTTEPPTPPEDEPPAPQTT
ncbi:hypothetical protein EASAB2608_04162 [Streptomyces sp. EAS-AB2608]|uniref:hypothetical protein n=1 Tax=Streptomyces sp. EAS-AB2608 TaxID=2779671 RepID=UPI001BEF6728|nr:hypothetical protein [Streptomyces sp. EAS-AB2608]BCM68828.1 hypothetical protein EASAB2608_04162 [Streptomyces sp. EAS-AB2608]